MAQNLIQIIRPSYEILDPLDGPEMLKKIEAITRVSRKSEERITEKSAEKLIGDCIRRNTGEETILEHCSVSVKFICDRGVTHEMVRHRLCSFMQESTRYCNYTSGKFGEKIAVILPYEYPLPEEMERSDNTFDIWLEAMNNAAASYNKLIAAGVSPQEARAVLPHSTKAEIVVTANLREWRHIFKLRCARGAHPQMRQLMIPLALEFREKIPVIYDDLDIPEIIPAAAFAVRKVDKETAGAE